jgi:hypothetical protein
MSNSRHHGADLAHVGMVGGHNAHNLALAQGRNAVAKIQNFVKLETHHQNRPPFVALVHQPLVDVLDGADVELEAAPRLS